MLQSLNHHRFAIRLTVEAIILKVIFQVIGLGLVGGYGMSLSNGLAFGIVFVRGYHFMCKEYRIAPLAKISNFFLKNFPLHPDYACSMFCRFLFAESAIVNGIKKLCNDLLCGCRKYWRLSIFIFSIRKKWVSNVEKC